MTTLTPDATLTSDREIVMTRVFDAPRALVFKAWTDPAYLAHWWGPSGFRNTIHEIDIKPGGVWRFMMHGPDGVDYPNLIVFDEVVAPEKLTFSHGTGQDDGVEPFQVTVTFAEIDGKTELTMRSVFASAEICENVKAFGAVELGYQTLERFARHLATTLERDEFVISRTFAAPRELVWKVFTEAEHLNHWWGPKGFTLKSSELSLRPDGVYHYCMTSPDGHEMWGKFVYCQIQPPERLVFINSFSDAEGNLTRHPMAPTWPQEVLNVMTLTESEGQTTMTMRGAPYNANALESETFASNHASMQQGFKGTWDQLEAYLARIQSQVQA